VTAAPILGYDFPLDGPNGWHEAHRYLIWTGHFPPGAPATALQERTAGVTTTFPVKPRSLSLVAAGTPHRLTHLFGFWRISDCDMLVVRAELPEATYLCLYISSGPRHRTDRVVWYCPQCGTELAPWSHDVQRFGAGAFWDRSLEAVRAFNAAAALRTCAHCGAVHPAAFGFDSDLDSQAEQEARALW